MSRTIKSTAIILEPTSASAADGKVFVGVTEERYFSLKETFEGRKLSLITDCMLQKLRRYADAPESAPSFNLPAFIGRKVTNFANDVILTAVLFSNKDSRKAAQDYILARHEEGATN